MTKPSLYDININSALPQAMRATPRMIRLSFKKKRPSSTSEGGPSRKWVPPSSSTAAPRPAEASSTGAAGTDDFGIVIALPLGTVLPIAAKSLMHNMAHLCEAVVGLNLVKRKLEGIDIGRLNPYAEIEEDDQPPAEVPLKPAPPAADPTVSKPVVIPGPTIDPIIDVEAEMLSDEF
ncbi:hypothetical protein COCNU_scaffold001675G000010 [Cocos nucifera]|nr:hypothetical protein [Cocos nucifera]